MIDHARVIQALERKQQELTAYVQAVRQESQRLQHLLQRLGQESLASLQGKLEASGTEWPGALPTVEFGQAPDLCLPFSPSREWGTHRASREWALAVLYERPTIAVDGSQITPSKDFSVPVGAVQVGWFINEHRPAMPNRPAYVKDVEFELLSPRELETEAEEEPSDFPNWRVNQERFVRECHKLCELMAHYGDRDEAQRPLCFFDGSFIISFAGQLRPGRAAPYLRAVTELLDCAEETRTPLVGFVDTSYSRDLVTLLNTLYPEAALHHLSDAGLLSPLLTGWGDRSPFFICARPDALSRDGRAAFYKRVGFTYMRLVRDRPPARLELPRWLLDSGQLEPVLDRVRAECVVANGYPYAIETADAVAVIGHQDRERFYRILQEFLRREGVPLTVSRKLRSKRARRA